MIEEINSKQSMWRAALNSRFAHVKVGAAKSLCGALPTSDETKAREVAAGRLVIVNNASESYTAPDSFDSATNWPMCNKTIADIRDQSDCGCCWAFGAAEAASDRLCIATQGKIQVPLSADDVCFCASEDGCMGGDISSPWEYIKSTGAVTGGQVGDTGPFQGMCADFPMPHCHHHGPRGSDPYPGEGDKGCPSQQSAECPTKCDSDAKSPHDDFGSDKYVFDGDVISASGEDGVARAIMAGGPVETAFTVYTDFENYASGIYHHVTGGVAGGHAVKIVGWGEENGEKYWKVANSWNPYWAEKGYFRIRKGTNECGIEDNVTGSSPDAKWSKKSDQGVESLVV